MDGLQWKTLLKMEDLGLPLFLETPIYIWLEIRFHYFKGGLHGTGPGRWTSRPAGELLRLKKNQELSQHWQLSKGIDLEIWKQNGSSVLFILLFSIFRCCVFMCFFSDYDSKQIWLAFWEPWLEVCETPERK